MYNPSVISTITDATIARLLWIGSVVIDFIHADEDIEATNREKGEHHFRGPKLCGYCLALNNKKD